MEQQFLFIGGPHNGQTLTVQNPGLTQNINGTQYTLNTINGQEIYTEAHMCYREAKAATNHWQKRNPPPPTTWQPPTQTTPTPTDFPTNVEETAPAVTSDNNQEVP